MMIKEKRQPVAAGWQQATLSARDAWRRVGERHDAQTQKKL
jgi:hypothetical protein